MKQFIVFTKSGIKTVIENRKTIIEKDVSRCPKCGLKFDNEIYGKNTHCGVQLVPNKRMYTERKYL